MREEDRIWIIAGNVREATDWARDQRMPLGRVNWVASPDDLRGVDLSDPVHGLVWVGTFRDRLDFEDLVAAVDMRGGPPPPPSRSDPYLEELAKRTALSPEAIKALFDGPDSQKPVVPTILKDGPEFLVPYFSIAASINETVLDPDERAALVNRLIDILVVWDPRFDPIGFRDAAGG
jgi:hypothetical protein